MDEGMIFLKKILGFQYRYVDNVITNRVRNMRLPERNYEYEKKQLQHQQNNQ